MAVNHSRNITVSLSPETIHKAKVLAAQRSTSISRLLADQVEALVGTEDAYTSARNVALARMERGFHLGGVRVTNRDELHER
jgi:predicted transcriptional regulator